MASKTEAVNIALGRLGITRRLADVDTDSTKEAVQARLVYDSVLDETLRAFPWNFAQTSVALAETAEAVVIPGYQYQYAYPSNCLTAHIVCSSDGVREAFDGWVQYWERTRLLPPKYPFKVALHPDGDRRVILTDVDEAYLIYTARVTDTIAWDPLFLNAFCDRLSAELATALVEGAGGRQAFQLAMARYAQSWQSAAAMSMNEAREDERPDSPSITSRL